MAENQSSLHIHQAVSAWFLGPQAENAELLKDLFGRVLADHVSARKSYHPQDGVFTSDDVKQSQAYRRIVERLQKKLADLSTLFNEFSTPFYSPRYAAHSTFENSFPSIVGWLSAMLLNPNNVSFEAAPITTALELEVGQDLCKMIGFENTKDIRGWGHLTCDGTVANVEALWAARNLKFYPLALKAAMAPNAPLYFISDRFKVLGCPPGAPHELFRDLDTWDLLNLRSEDILEIPDRFAREFGISSRFLETTMSKYIVQATGMNALYTKWGVEDSPKVLIASTKHSSWPKGVGRHARIDLIALRHALDRCLSERQAVYVVVATIGTTEEGAVDPLAKIIELREEYQKKGLSFFIHADAAWGGYFTSTLRDPSPEWNSQWPKSDDSGERAIFDRDYVPTVSLTPYTIHQLEALKGADSVTIDPHKSGYCPHPAGGLCYRDRRLRHLLTWSAPYIEHGKRGEDISIYGVEGSKPGAAAASVYMHHSIIGLHNQGHGGLLGEVSFACARMAAHWATMSDRDAPYTVTTFNPLRFEPDSNAVESEKDFIRHQILGRSNEDIVKDPDPGVMAELRSLGSDLNINAFVCNFRLKVKKKSGAKQKIGSGAADPDEHDDGEWEWVVNDDVAEANYLNRCIFDRLSLTDLGQNPRTTPLFLSSAILKHEDYGECLKHFKERAGLETESTQDLFVLRNVIMSPFQASADLVANIADAFKNVLQDSIKHVSHRNTITPQIFHFTVQGTDRMYLAYRPLFHKANGRQQLILEVDVPDKGEWSEYLELRRAHPNSIFTLSNSPGLPITIDDLLSAPGRTPCLITAKEFFSTEYIKMNLTISNARVLKNRSLSSRWQDSDYDSKYTPFYLYGTPEQQHIDHMLLKAPDAQFTAENVSLVLDHPIPAQKLASGVLLFLLNFPERAMQPFDSSGSRDAPCLFYPNAKFEVMVCDDPFPATAHGPGLAVASDHLPVISRGTMQLPLNVFTDLVDLNREDFRDDERTTQRMSKDMNWEDQSAWRAMVMKRLDRPHSEYYSTKNLRADGEIGDGHDLSKKPDMGQEKRADQDVRDAGYGASGGMN